MNGARPPTALPELAIVRVLTSGGPYRSGDTLSLALNQPTVGRLASHAPDLLDEWCIADACVPETISVSVTVACATYAVGDELTLSFIDPHIARVHRVEVRDPADCLQTAGPEGSHGSWSPPLVQVATIAPPPPTPDRPLETREGNEPPAAGGIAAAYLPERSDIRRLGGRPDDGAIACGITVRSHWTEERVRRFVALVDKLFTVERLGWYRHVFAMRLLIPDQIATADPVAQAQSMQHLHALRAAIGQTLGNPLLAAFMPNFNVSTEWLEMLESAAAARSIAALRETLLPLADEGSAIVHPEPDWTVGTVTADALHASSAQSLEALLPIFIPASARDVAFGARLLEYRRALVTAFGQVVGTSQLVRLGAMTQPHHALDDRLWHLIGALSAAFEQRPQSLPTSDTVGATR